MEVRGAGEVRQFEAIRLRSELNTRRILETVYGTRRSDGHYRLLYLYYKLSYSGQFTTVLYHFWRERAKNKDPGAVHLLTGSPIRSFRPCGFAAALASVCPTRAALLTSPPLILLPPLTILSPLCLPVML